MHGLGRITLVASVLLAALLLSPFPVSACDFEPPPPPQEALDEATAVFSGEVTAIEQVDDDPSEQFLAVTFSVDRVWKGVDSSPVTVETHQDEGICGFPFEQGEIYLVYAHSNGSPLTTALYHRTQLLDRADDDLAALGEGTEVSTQAEADDDGTGTISAGVLVLIVVIASIILATVMLLRQSKPGLPESYDEHDAGDDDPAGDRR